MKFKFVFIALCFISSFSHAQWQERGSTFDLAHLERHQFKVDLLSPGFTYELGLFKNQGISTNLGLATAHVRKGLCFWAGIQQPLL